MIFSSNTPFPPSFWASASPFLLPTPFFVSSLYLYLFIFKFYLSIILSFLLNQSTYLKISFFFFHPSPTPSLYFAQTYMRILDCIIWICTCSLLVYEQEILVVCCLLASQRQQHLILCFLVDFAHGPCGWPLLPQNAKVLRFFLQSGRIFWNWIQG